MERHITRHILIVDDDPIHTDNLEIAFRRHYHIHTASDGKQGLARMRELQPDLVLVDIRMPHIDGFEFCRQAKLDISINHIPIIVMTAWGRQRNEKEAFQAGAWDFVEKPFDVEVLTQKINIWLDKVAIGKTIDSLPKSPPQKKIYISYSSKDRPYVSGELTSLLEKEGFSYWWDKRDIGIGKRWTVEIEKALEETTLMILVLSHNSILSNFVLIEYMDFLKRGKPIFWIKIQDCVTPRLLDIFQGIEYSNNRIEQHEKLLKDLRETLK